MIADAAVEVVTLLAGVFIAAVAAVVAAGYGAVMAVGWLARRWSEVETGDRPP